MKAEIRIGEFGGKVEVQRGKATISSDFDDFSVWMKEVKAPGVKTIRVLPKDLLFEIEQEDGWILAIEKGIHDQEHLIVTRYKMLESGMLTYEYLTVNREWLPKPAGYNPYPSDTMKIPAPK